MQVAGCRSAYRETALGPSRRPGRPNARSAAAPRRHRPRAYCPLPPWSFTTPRCEHNSSRLPLWRHRPSATWVSRWMTRSQLPSRSTSDSWGRADALCPPPNVRGVPSAELRRGAGNGRAAHWRLDSLTGRYTPTFEVYPYHSRNTRRVTAEVRHGPIANSTRGDSSARRCHETASSCPTPNSPP